jgi:hypothetical protein
MVNHPLSKLMPKTNCFQSCVICDHSPQGLAVSPESLAAEVYQESERQSTDG